MSTASAVARSGVVNDATATAPHPQETERLRRENDELSAENRVLQLKVQKLQRMLWDKKSERMPRDDKQGVFFDEAAETRNNATPAAAAAKKKSDGRSPRPKGPKPLDPRCRGK